MTKSFQSSLKERLQDHVYAQHYLEVALDAFENDGNMEVFQMALRDVAKAQGGFLKLSKKISMSRPNLYRQLSAEGNPSFKTVDNILHGLGFKLAIEPLNSSSFSGRE